MFLQLAHQHPDIREVGGCPLTARGESNAPLTSQASCADAGVAKQVEFDLFERAKECCQDEGIEIPFPYCNLVFKSMPPSG
jgi:hypothetical protein